MLSSCRCPSRELSSSITALQVEGMHDSLLSLASRSASSSACVKAQATFDKVSFFFFVNFLFAYFLSSYRTNLDDERED